MKKEMYKLTLALLLTFTFQLSTTFGQSPQKVSYQAVVRDASSNLVSNTQVGMQISILQTSADGTAVYVETHTPTTNANGLASIEIGSGTVVTGDFTTIDWANDTYFVKTETDPAGGTAYSITGVSQLLSVPYALHAKTAENVTGTITETDPVYSAWNKDYADLTNKPVNATTTTDGFMSSADKTKLAGIAEGAEVNVQPDWNATSGDAQIANKPDLSSYATKDMSDENITNLADPVNAQDAATKAYVDALKLEIYAEIGVTDYDGNHYNAVKIGNQVWMAENLKVTHYPNGDDIPLVTDNSAWGALANDNISDAMCYYNNNASDEADTYGALYTYAAAIGDNWARDNTANQGVCPDGWHLPTDAEWTTLVTYLGADAGSKLAGNAALWTDGNLDQNANFGASGFSALPGGERIDGDGSFSDLGDYGDWWSSTQYSSSYAYYRYLDYSFSTMIRYDINKSYGYSVRCVRD